MLDFNMMNLRNGLILKLSPYDLRIIRCNLQKYICLYIIYFFCSRSHAKIFVSDVSFYWMGQLHLFLHRHLMSHHFRNVPVTIVLFRSVYLFKLQVRRNAVVHTTANDHNGIICLLKCIMSYTSDAAEHRQIDRWLDGHKQTQSIRGPVQYSQNQQSILSVNSTKVWVIKPLEGAVQTSHGLFIDHAC